MVSLTLTQNRDVAWHIRAIVNAYLTTTVGKQLKSGCVVVWYPRLDDWSITIEFKYGNKTAAKCTVPYCLEPTPKDIGECVPQLAAQLLLTDIAVENNSNKDYSLSPGKIHYAS